MALDDKDAASHCPAFVRYVALFPQCSLGLIQSLFELMSFPFDLIDLH